MTQVFKAGDTIPQSGIYRLSHENEAAGAAAAAVVAGE